MNKKAINSVLSKKFNDFVASIKDPEVAALVRKNSIITGGCIVSLLLDEEPNDFDLYFTDKKTVKAVCQYYCNEFNARNSGRTNKLGKTGKAWVLDGEDVEKWKAGNLSLTSFAHGYEKDVGTGFASRMITNTSADRIKVMINSDGVAEDNTLDAPKMLDEMDDTPFDLAEDTAKEREGKYLVELILLLEH